MPCRALLHKPQGSTGDGRLKVWYHTQIIANTVGSQQANQYAFEPRVMTQSLVSTTTLNSSPKDVQSMTY